MVATVFMFKLKGTLLGLRQFLAIESSLKIMKKAFYVTFLFSLSKYLNFRLDFLVMKKNDLIWKILLISKFMTSNPGKQTVAMHILSNISRSKSDKTMKFGQLIKCKMRNIFLEKSYLKCGGETIHRTFLSKLRISMDQQSKVL